MSRLVGKVAIVTGGAPRQRALEAELLCKGAKVIICDILDQEGKDVDTLASDEYS